MNVPLLERNLDVASQIVVFSMVILSYLFADEAGADVFPIIICMSNDPFYHIHRMRLLFLEK